MGDPRQGGVFTGIAGDRNSLAEAFDSEKQSVKNLVKHFSLAKPGDIPPQFLPQQYMQNSGEAPPLSYLKAQAQSKDISHKEKTEIKTTGPKITKDPGEDTEERLKLFQRRGSLKDYLMMDFEDAKREQQQQQQATSILDPSAILQVDGSIETGLAKKRTAVDSMGRECDSEGRLIDTDKWDNHNTIARGWLSSGEDHYQPVTFRKIYNRQSVTGPSPLPERVQSQPLPAQHQDEPEAVVETQQPEEPREEGYADL